VTFTAADRISTERTETVEDMVALAQQLDLDGLAALAPRIPPPPG